MLGQETSHFEEGGAHMRTVLKVKSASYVSLVHSAWHKTCLLKK